MPLECVCETKEGAGKEKWVLPLDSIVALVLVGTLAGAGREQAEKWLLGHESVGVRSRKGGSEWLFLGPTSSKIFFV